MTQLGVSADSIVMNVGSAAVGYGYEYVVSTLDRIKAAALSQDDKMLQMPIITPIASETWNVKEAMAGLRISHDAVVSVLSTQQSYNTIVAYVQGIDGYKYSNYTDVMDIVAEATRTMTELDNTAFTDQATLVSQYTTLITNIANALLELQTAFTGTEDGSVVNSTTGTTEAQGADDIYSYLYNQITNITYLKHSPAQLPT